MKLTTKDITTLRDIINFYSNRKIDYFYIKDILNIINKEKTIKLIKNSYYDPPFVEMDTGMLFINLDYFMNLNKEQSKDDEYMFHIYSIITLIHEVVHIRQYEDSKTYEVINQLFKELYSGSKYTKMIYDALGHCFFHERMANLIAYQEAMFIPENKEIHDFIKKYYLSILCDGYDLVTTPVKLTYELINKDYNLDCSSLSFKQRVQYGFDLTNEEYFNLFGDFKDSFDNIDETKILKLIR